MGPEVIIGVICGIVALVVGALVGWIGGITYRKRVAEAEIGSAEERQSPSWTVRRSRRRR